MTASEHPSVQRYAKHVNPAFVKMLGAFGYGRVFVRARGTRLWDDQGREYLDFLAGFGSVNLGHNPPRLIAKLREILGEDAVNLVHVGPQVYAGDLAEMLAARAGPLSMVMFSNSGAEAVEAGLKLARGVSGRGFVFCRGGFHGTNLGTLSVMGSARLRKPFEPLLPECHEIPFGDLGELEGKLKKHKIAAFLVEPILGEGGVCMPPRGYLKKARELCQRYGALLVLDEVQTGLGRTGTFFAYQAEDFVPDVLVLGKALGGSMAAISATLTRPDLHRQVFGSMDTFDLHGSTFSGNAFACRAAMETLAILDDEELVAASARQGKRLIAGLRDKLAGHPLVRSIRGRGLLVGVELGPTETGFMNRLLPGVVEEVSRRVFGQWLSLRLLERGILAQPASQQWNVLKLEPPLTVTDEEIDRVVTEIGEILGEYRDLGALLRDAGERLGKQALGGWSF
jgi:putrescine aminotransferase